MAGEDAGKETDIPKVLSRSWKPCLGPILAGGAVGVAHLSQGHYAAAILSVTTGAAMTLILLGGLSLGSLLLGLGETRRRG